MCASPVTSTGSGVQVGRRPEANDRVRAFNGHRIRNRSPHPARPTDFRPTITTNLQHQLNLQRLSWIHVSRYTTLPAPRTGNAQTTAGLWMPRTAQNHFKIQQRQPIPPSKLPKRGTPSSAHDAGCHPALPLCMFPHIAHELPALTASDPATDPQCRNGYWGHNTAAPPGTGSC